MFITFEGGEGVGKSTNISALESWLIDRGQQVVVTREPGGTPIAEIIREDLLKANHVESMVDMTELLLVYAARVQHYETVICPALQAGKWVLCDRFNDSTIAYQGYGRGLSLQRLNDLKQLVLGDVDPDLTILLDAPVSVGMARASSRALSLDSEVDRFEQQEIEFFDRVYQGFNTLAEQHDRIIKVDASQALAQVQQQIIHCVQQTARGSHLT